MKWPSANLISMNLEVTGYRDRFLSDWAGDEETLKKEADFDLALWISCFRERMLCAFAGAEWRRNSG